MRNIQQDILYDKLMDCVTEHLEVPLDDRMTVAEIMGLLLCLAVDVRESQADEESPTDTPSK